MKSHKTQLLMATTWLIALVVGTVSAQQPELIVQSGHSSDVWSLAISSDGKLLLSGADDGTVKLWDLSTRRELRSFGGNTDGINDGAFCAVAFLPDSKTFMSATTGGTITWWDITDGKKLNQFRNQSQPLTRVVLSADGSTIASIEEQNPTITIRSLSTGQHLRTLTDDSFVTAIAISPDGKSLASGNKNGSIQLWEIATGKRLKPLLAHTGYVWSLAWAPDGHTLASGSWDNSVRLWNVAEGKPIVSRTRQPRVVRSVFSRRSDLGV